MDVVIPRPKRAKEMKIRIEFQRLLEGPLVMKNMSMAGRASFILGIINIRFQVSGEFYDFQVTAKNEIEKNE